jgi:hypothetical protein
MSITSLNRNNDKKNMLHSRIKVDIERLSQSVVQNDWRRPAIIEYGLHIQVMRQHNQLLNMLRLQCRSPVGANQPTLGEDSFTGD